MQEFSNSEVRVSVEKKPGSRVELRVDASGAVVQSARKKAIRAIGKEVTLHGFRKGKAPEEAVLKNYPAQVDKQWKEEIANVTYLEALKLTKIQPLNRDTKVSFDVKRYSTEGAEIILVYEVEPEIPTVAPEQVTLKPVKRPEVNEEKVEETIRQTMLFFAEWEPVVDRAVQEGDYIRLDVENLEENPPSKLFSNTRFEVTPKSMAEWMRTTVLGLKTNESAEGISVPDNDLPEEEKKAFKPQKVRLTVKGIEKPTMPALDDAFAKRLGVESVDDLRKRIHQLLNDQADAHVQEELREQVNDYLINHVPFDLPPSLIQKETEFRMRQLYSDPEFQQSWSSTSDEDRKKMISSLYSQSEKAVRMFYICRKILADAGIKVSPRDLPAPPKNPLEALVRPQPIYHYQKEPEVHQAEVFSRVLLEKAQDHIIANANKNGVEQIAEQK